MENDKCPLCEFVAKGNDVLETFINLKNHAKKEHRNSMINHVVNKHFKVIEENFWDTIEE